MARLICPDCGHSSPEGTTLCNCGARFSPTSTAKPRPSPTQSAPTEARLNDPFADPGTRFALDVSSQRGRRSLHLNAGDLLEVGAVVGPLQDLCTDNVSGHHADIRVTVHGIEVTDMGTDGRGSTNGTFIDGARIPPCVPVPVGPGSSITCGTDPPLTIRLKGDDIRD